MTQSRCNHSGLAGAARLVVFCLPLLLAAGGCLKVEGPFKAAADCPATPTTSAEAGGDEAVVERLRQGPEDLKGAKPGGVLNVQLQVEPGGLNNLMDTRDAYSVYISNHIDEALVAFDSKTLEVKPVLAEKWEVSGGGKVVTFHLRKNVKFHDGQPFTAKDVRYSFDRMKDKTVKTTKIKFVFVDLERMEAPDPHTVRFHWTRPLYNVVSSMDSLRILPAHLYEGKDFDTNPLNRAPVGTGPFRFKEWITGDRIVIERNDDYWGEKSFLDKIVYRVAPDNNTALQMLKNGQLDWFVFEPDQWKQEEARFRSDPDFQVLVYSAPAYSYIPWNMRKPPFNDRRVRVAMSHAINMDAIVTQLYHGFARRLHSSSLPGSDEYDNGLKLIPHDPVRAAALLEEAGWKDTNGDGVRDKEVEVEEEGRKTLQRKDFAVEFLIPSGLQISQRVAELVRGDLEKVGVKAEVRKYEWATFIKKMQSHEFDAAMLGWRLSEESDPYQIWHSSQAETGSNYPGYMDPEADRLCESVRVTLDPLDRASQIRRLGYLVWRDQPYTFILQRKAVAVIHKRFRNVIPFEIHTLWDARRWWVDDSAGGAK
ncbi:MAG: Oligopeptide-binding protein AppA [Myxococcota bacterium]|nr:Oligopeptide-binding protein AppA [Myxococcota bacterium]